MALKTGVIVVDYVVSMSRTIYIFVALVLVLIAIWPSLGDLGSGIYTTYARNGFVSVAGDLFIYVVLFGIILWAAVQLGTNLVENYVSGRPVTLIAPIRIGAPDAENAEGVKLAQILSADLSILAVSAERSVPSTPEFDLFKKSQAFAQLPKGTGDGKDGLNLIFSTTPIGNAPVVDSLNLATNTKFEVSGTDLTPYIAWLINKFRRNNQLELTITDLKPGRKLFWNLDTARSGWDNLTLRCSTNDAAVEEFTWKYAHSLASRSPSQKSAAFHALSARQYRTIVRAYALYGDAIRDAGLNPDRQMGSTFTRILQLMETGVDPGPPLSEAQPNTTSAPASEACEQPASTDASVKEVAALWWELSKSFAVLASLAGQHDKARTYAQLALALLPREKDRPDKSVISALEAFVPEIIPSKSTPSTAKPDRSPVIFLTTKPLPVINPKETDDIDENVRSTLEGKIQLFELKQPISGTVSALEAVQLSGLPCKARLILNLPLEIIKSPALPKLIKDDLNPSETIIYTRADAAAVAYLQQNYPGATVCDQGQLTSEAIRKNEMKPPTTSANSPVSPLGNPITCP